ncbi:MAG TPA: M23 family metallopeptidase [Bacillota bacterium]|nr:M23 family metallopeptidase [Bacillota bacterium]
MRRNIFLALIVILIISPIRFTFAAAENNELKTCAQFFSPFNEPNRARYQTIINRCISKYSDYRSSTIKGHKHAGIDLRGKFSESVYPIGYGEVYDILYSFPNLAIVIYHPLPNHSYIYSIYTHVVDIQVKIGAWIDQNTVIARLFDAEEKRKAEFQTNHLHLEIRKSMEDNGRASYASMTMADLNRFCTDPREFLKKNLKN